MCVLCHSVMSDSATPCTVACQAPLSIEFSRQEYWSGLPFPTPGESSQPRDQTHISCISCIDRQILYHCARVYILYLYINICIYQNNCLNSMKRGCRGKGSPLVKLRPHPPKRKQVWHRSCITISSCSAHTLGILMIWHHRELYTKTFLWHSFYKLFGRGRV